MNNRWRQMLHATTKKRIDFTIPTKFYVLKGNRHVLSKNVYYTEIYLKYGNRKIGRTKINTDVFVSTVFLSLDMGFFSTKPVLYETMIFGGKCDGVIWRYHTKKEAIKGHNEIVNMVREKERESS